jgi:hypothetical protein
MAEFRQFKQDYFWLSGEVGAAIDPNSDELRGEENHVQ